MSTAVSPSPKRSSPLRRIFYWALVVTGFAVVAVAAAAINVVTLSRDARLMRNEILSTMHGDSHTQVQLTVGPALLAVARVGLGFCDELPSEARLALRAVNAASVGVYQLSDQGNDDSGRAKLFAATDKVMSRRGWTRVVGVNDHDATVLVYMPEITRDRGVQRVCLAVCKRDQLVIVAASGNTEPLLELAANSKNRIRL